MSKEPHLRLFFIATGYKLNIWINKFTATIYLPKRDTLHIKNIKFVKMSLTL